MLFRSMNEIAPSITARSMQTIDLAELASSGLAKPVRVNLNITRMCLAVRLGITRWLLEARA